MGYILINPRIDGSSLNSNKKNNNEAAEDIWSQMSSNIKNYTPEFYFTIQNGGSHKLSHYVVKESIENSQVKYSLKQFNNKKINEKALLEEIKLAGGHKKYKKHGKDDDSSSSSSSSSSSPEMIFTFPAGKNHKDLLALTYYPTIYGVPNIILPTFSTSFVPYVNIGIPNVIIFP